MSLYLILDLGSLAVPLIMSFHPKLRFHEKWPFVLPGILISMIFFILWDIWFTSKGYWGFNEEHLLGKEFFGLPIEEWLFFICIPYACLFTHHCLTVLFPRVLDMGRISGKLLGFLIIATCILLIIFYYDRQYTFYASLITALLVVYALWRDPITFRAYLYTYMVILLPFCIVNGVLTGHITENPVVWYNDAQNMGLRFGTIPLEDFIYNFALLFLPLAIATGLEKSSKKKTNVANHA